jgi:hypothetical protein
MKRGGEAVRRSAFPMLGTNTDPWEQAHVSDFLWYSAPILARLVHFADNRQFAQPDSLATRVATNLDGRET